jgi:hypothetical protein
MKSLGILQLILWYKMSTSFSRQNQRGEKKPEGTKKNGKSNDVAMTSEVQELLRWCQGICSKYEISISDFTSSFADGRALAYIIYHHQPSVFYILDSNEFANETYSNSLLPSLSQIFSRDRINDDTNITKPGACKTSIQ